MTKDISKNYVVEEEWRNLIILDACRYDIFEQVNWISGELEIRETIANFYNTVNWIDRNFLNREEMELSNIIYFSASPNALYHKFIKKGERIWESDENISEHGVVLPDKMGKRILEYLPKYLKDGLRFIYHFLQPHFPFINEDVDSPLRVKKEMWGSSKFVINEYGKRHGWEKVKKAYTENLRSVVRVVENLIFKLPDGKTVISSDHGERLGEGNIFGHDIDEEITQEEHKVLRLIPWFIVDRDYYKIKNERLKPLGYID